MAIQQIASKHAICPFQVSHPLKVLRAVVNKCNIEFVTVTEQIDLLLDIQMFCILESN